jgi:phenylalanyl-tRNA synthetase beta subunit
MGIADVTDEQIKKVLSHCGLNVGATMLEVNVHSLRKRINETPDLCTWYAGKKNRRGWDRMQLGY